MPKRLTCESNVPLPLTLGLWKLGTRLLGQTSPVDRMKAALERSPFSMGELLRYPLSLSPDASTAKPLPLRFLYAPSHTSFHIRNLSVYLRIPCPFIHKKGGNAIVSPRDSFNQCTSLCWLRLIEVFASVFNPLRYCGVVIGTPSSRAYSMKWLRYTIVFILVSSSSGTIAA